MPTDKHYTQTPSHVYARRRGAVFVVQSGGFVTRDMIKHEMVRWREEYPLPPGMLIDLTEVAGYGDGAAELARQWLATARARGVERVAFVAGSSVLRTATELLSKQLEIDLRGFADLDAAHGWLERHAPLTGEDSGRAAAGPDAQRDHAGRTTWRRRGAPAPR